MLHRFGCWTLIWLLYPWAWLLRGYWRYRNLIDCIVCLLQWQKYCNLIVSVPVIFRSPVLSGGSTSWEHEEQPGTRLHRITITADGSRPNAKFRINPLDNTLIWTCDFCAKTFRSEMGMKQHRALHTGNAPSCNICGKVFTSRIALQRHKDGVHDNKVYKCDVCGAAFNRSNNLRRHTKGHEFLQQCHITEDQS